MFLLEERKGQAGNPLKAGSHRDLSASNLPAIHLVHCILCIPCVPELYEAEPSQSPAD